MLSFFVPVSVEAASGRQSVRYGYVDSSFNHGFFESYDSNLFDLISYGADYSNDYKDPN